MTGVERLHRMANSSRGCSGLQSLSDTLEEIAHSIEISQAADHLIAVWVRDHGGIDELKKMEKLAIKGEVESSAVKALRELAGVKQDETASIHSMKKEIRGRLMPPGYEWPRYEDGEPVMIGDEFIADLTKKVDKVEIVKCGFYLKTSRNDFYWYHKGVRVKRPKQDPVGADDLPIRNGDEVWAVRDGNGPFKVVSIDLGAELPITLTRGDGGILMARCTPDELTHTKPDNPDSWERWREESALDACDYFKRASGAHDCGDCPADRHHDCEIDKASDLERRAKALAERERDER